MTRPLHVVVTGGRQYADANRIWLDLGVAADLGCVRVAQGGATGADTLARGAWRTVVASQSEIASEDECEWQGTYSVVEYLDGPWPGAGSNRNGRMIKAEIALARQTKARLLGLAYPDLDSVGTWDCVRRLLRNGVSVLVRACDANWTMHLRSKPHLLPVSDGADHAWLAVPEWLVKVDALDPYRETATAFARNPR